MAKLTRQQRTILESAYRNLARAIRYVDSDATIVARLNTRPATTTLDYHSHDGATSLTPVNKDIGSDLTGLKMAWSDLHFVLTGARYESDQ